MKRDRVGKATKKRGRPDMPGRLNVSSPPFVIEIIRQGPKYSVASKAADACAAVANAATANEP